MADADVYQRETERLLRDDSPSASLMCATHKHVPRVLLDALAASTRIKTAHFELTEWNDESCAMLLASGGPNEALDSLFLTRNHITSAGLPMLSAAAISRGRLKNLNLSSNPLGDQLASLAQSVVTSHIEQLTLDETQQRGEGILGLATALAAGAGTCKLRALHLQNNGIDDHVASSVAALLVSTGVHELLLGRNAIADRGASKFALAIAPRHGARCALRRLSLVFNQVTNAGACDFAHALADPASSLLMLNLGHNLIGDAGCAALTRAVQHNHRLEKLDLGVNPAAKHATDALRVAMSAEARKQRQHIAFLGVAKLLLLAQSRPYVPEAADPPSWASLPHCVLVQILQLASPLA